MNSVYVFTDPGNAKHIGEAEDADAAIVLAESIGFIAANIGCTRHSTPVGVDFWLVFPSWKQQGIELMKISCRD